MWLLFTNISLPLLLQAQDLLDQVITVTVSGVTDIVGNAAANVTWSFYGTEPACPTASFIEDAPQFAVTAYVTA